MALKTDAADVDHAENGYGIPAYNVQQHGAFKRSCRLPMRLIAP